MIIKAAPKRLHAQKAGGRSFNAAVNYILAKFANDPSITTPSFAEAINYVANLTDNPLTTEPGEKCVAVATQGVTSLAAAIAEMDAVAAQNPRCKDPVFHIILSWPEHERPNKDAIFSAARHALAGINLADHQHVIAIHSNTDNIHAHIAVNRIHPTTFRSQHLSYVWKDLHYAARESEIAHNWSHDNGIFIVTTDKHGNKTIELNPESRLRNANHPNYQPTVDIWHDADSLQAHLKKAVAPTLKTALPTFRSWQDLHTHLAAHQIRLTDSGGGGMQLHAIDEETGERITIPASRPFRFLKRPELEQRFGEFIASQLTNNQETHHDEIDTTTGTNRSAPIYRIPDTLPPNTPRIPTPPPKPAPPDTAGDDGSGERPPAHGRQRMHHLSEIDVVSEGGNLAGMLLSRPVRHHLDDLKTLEDHPLRYPADRSRDHERGTSAGSDGRTDDRVTDTSPATTQRTPRDPAAREHNRNERAAARLDLRRRYQTYCSFVRDGDTDYFAAKQKTTAERAAALKALRADNTTARQSIQKDPALSAQNKIALQLQLTTERLTRRLTIEAAHQSRLDALAASRQPPMTWRDWLQESAQNGDTAALAALRGMIYQEKRDAKSRPTTDNVIPATPTPTDPLTAEYQEIAKHLTEEEKDELAIRPTNPNQMRPWQAAPLLREAAKITYKITGNGNVQYFTAENRHLYTDRGNRITFDREIVTDDDIRLAILHAQEKYGARLTLTGSDPIFLERMTKLATEMNITVINPELQPIVEAHRRSLKETAKQPTTTTTKKPQKSAPPTKAPQSAKPAASQPAPITPSTQPTPAPNTRHPLHIAALAIDPRAEITEAETDQTYHGRIIATTETHCIQHLGQSHYVTHALAHPPTDKPIQVAYKDDIATIGTTAPTTPRRI